MNKEEFRCFMENGVAGYTETLIRGRALDRELARREAEEAFYGMFPEGPETEDQFLAFIVDAQSDKTVGEIWFGYEEEDGVPQVYLSEFLIYEPDRRKGYAAAALAEMERIAGANGCAMSALYVWDHNPGAYALYQKCGYSAVSHGNGGSYMKKKL